MNSQASTEKIWNVPNKLSAARLGLAFVVFALIAAGHQESMLYWAALFFFVVAAATDALDGWWARRFNQITQLGRILDPFCDKIIICGTLILMAVAMRDQFPWYCRMFGWIAVIVVGRELLVTALRSFVEQAGGDFSAGLAGKLKMVFQCGSVIFGLIALAAYGETLSASTDENEVRQLPVWLSVCMAAVNLATVVTTIQSGWGYVLAAWTRIAPTNTSA